MSIKNLFVIKTTFLFLSIIFSFRELSVAYRKRYKVRHFENFIRNKKKKMSLVHAFPVPEVLWFDWAVIFVGLGLGVGGVFGILGLSATTKQEEARLYTWTNFWLVMSGVIHVSCLFAVERNNSLSLGRFGSNLTSPFIEPRPSSSQD